MSLSIIVCSTKPDLVDELKLNIAETIGDNAVYELIVIDNKTSPRPLAQVYNEGGRRAKYENLLFIHQDAGFVTHDWLEQIETQLATPDCGVIGFAGSRLIFNYPGGWFDSGVNWAITHYETEKRRMDWQCPEGEAFVEVVAIDGFAMFVKKDVWIRHPFDEEALTGFHCYDMDFSMSIFPEYKNYVCCSVLPYHHSPGNFDKSWAYQTNDIYEKKWKHILPLHTPDVVLTPSEFAYLEERACFRMIKKLSKMGFSTSVLAKRFLKYPPKPRHLEHLLKYFTYEVRRMSKL